MRAIFCCAVLAVVLNFGVNGADEAKYVCKTGGALEITSIIVDTFTPQRAQAPSKSTSCATGLSAGNNIVVIGGSGTTGAPYTATIPQTGTVSCGVTSSGTVFTYKIIVASKATIIQSSDIMFTFTCDSANLNNDATKTAKITSVTGDPTAGTVTKDIPVVLTLTTAADFNNPISTTTLGTSVTMKMALTKQNKPVQKCKVTTCEAAPTSAFSSTIELIGSNGCTSTTGGVYTATTGNFPQDASTTNNIAYYKSTAFNMFRFSDTAEVHLRCTCQGCLTAGDAACNTATCTGGRKRRDVSTNNATQSMASAVLFVLDSRKELSSTNIAERQEVTFNNCLNHVSFISVVAILALLLMISLGVSVFFCSKLIRQREQPKECYPNPAYKA